MMNEVPFNVHLGHAILTIATALTSDFHTFHTHRRRRLLSLAAIMAHPHSSVDRYSTWAVVRTLHHTANAFATHMPSATTFLVSALQTTACTYNLTF